ncbi:hypothetical protein QO004_001978 [Rhizobium mesoamericanum]|uniref:hypothetical protein n=1 Tax=Rhizobium mesoamericanum TaxID=1079800 RepID=UPI002788541D|nr:hypothetical protein [Rhizobium mesoamericanum]MDQ0560196.1 hypothetical protein [Rhizobium mesoamericanum]
MPNASGDDERARGIGGKHLMVAVYPFKRPVRLLGVDAFVTDNRRVGDAPPQP